MNDKVKVIFFSLLTAAALWAGDAAIDAFVFQEGRFFDLLAFSLSTRELYSRLFLITVLACFGIVITKIHDVMEMRRTREESKKNREKLEQQVAERTEELNAVNELLRKEIADHTRTEEELSRSENFLNNTFHSFYDPFSILDHEYRIVKFNDAYARMRGKLATDLYGKRCYELFYNRDAVCPGCVVDKTFLSGDPCAKEKQVTLNDGSTAWVEIYTYPILDRDKKVTHVVEYSRDITDRKKSEEEKKQLIENLNYLSTTDVLTGLLNRRALNDILKHEIDRASRYYTDLAMILCDVDKFKRINDTHGHTIGDQALKAVAECLKASIRRADILGRYGGDEFMIVLPETSLEGARSLAEKIRNTVERQSIELPGNKRIRLSISVGVTSCCTAGENIDTFVALADTALYTSKNAGRNKVSVVGK